MLAIVAFVLVGHGAPEAFKQSASLAVARSEVDALVAGLFDSDEPASVALPGVAICDLAVARDMDVTAARTCIERHMKSCRPAVAARAVIDFSSHEWQQFSILWVRPNPRGCDLIHIVDSRTRPLGPVSAGQVVAQRCSLPFSIGLHPLPDISYMLNCERTVAIK